MVAAALVSAAAFAQVEITPVFDSETKTLSLNMATELTVAGAGWNDLILPEGTNVVIKSVYDEDEEEYIDVPQILKGDKCKSAQILKPIKTKSGGYSVTIYNGNFKAGGTSICDIVLEGDCAGKGKIVNFSTSTPEGKMIESAPYDIEFELTATGIKGITVDGVENGAIYNLAGQRVNAAQKGIFIQNGKKVAVK